MAKEQKHWHIEMMYKKCTDIFSSDPSLSQFKEHLERSKQLLSAELFLTNQWNVFVGELLSFLHSIEARSEIEKE